MEYEAYYLTVHLEWMAEKGVDYSVNIEAAEPMAVIENVTKAVTASNAHMQLTATLPYNTHYNVSIEATLCGQTNISDVIGIYYRELFTPHGHFSIKQVL